MIMAIYFALVIVCAKRGTLQVEFDIYGKMRHAKGVFQKLKGKENDFNERF